METTHAPGSVPSPQVLADWVARLVRSPSVNPLHVGPHCGEPGEQAQALAEAERQGITTFCITIDPAGHDYLRRMCPEQRYLVVDDVHQLPAELDKVYRALTGRGPGVRVRERFPVSNATRA